MKPYIFGHRGASGYEIENTLNSFKKAVEMGAGIETDVHLTKDNILVCFHDPFIEIESKTYSIKKLTWEELNNFKFQDGLEIPALENVFETFKECVRYSCDIGSRKVGFELIKLVEKYSLFDHLEITDQKPRLLEKLRESNKKIKLIHTIPHFLSIINNRSVDFDTLLNNDINILNVKLERLKKSFKTIIDHGFKCYVWGVNTKYSMKKILQMKYKDEYVSAIYTNYPDVLLEIRGQFFD